MSYHRDRNSVLNALCTIKTAASVPFLYEQTMGDWILDFQVKSIKIGVFQALSVYIKGFCTENSLVFP